MGHDLGIGVSFRMSHLSDIQNSEVPIDWFELITDQFLVPSKKTSLVLEYLKGRFPLVLHGVSLGIGNSMPLDFEYLKKVKTLAKQITSPWVTEHLSWGQVPGAHFHELLPLPFTREVADYVAERAKIVQDYLEVPFALENISSYLEDDQKEMEEWDFYSYVVEKSNTYMLVDANNIYVSAKNIGFDPYTYLKALPYEKIIQMHLAGHLDKGDWIIDTHAEKVRDEVWDLYQKIWVKANRPATLLEIEEDGVSFTFEETCNEALKAKKYQQEAFHGYSTLSS